MKTIIFKTLLSCAAILPLASCSRDGLSPGGGEDPGNGGGDMPVDIVVTKVATATGVGGGGENDTKFMPGCRIGITVAGNAGYTNREYKYPEHGSTLVPVGSPVFWDKGVTAMRVNAYYPYRSDGAYTQAYVESDQRTRDAYFLSDALSSTGTVSGRGTGLTLSSFTHRSAKVIFTFDEDVAGVTILKQSLNTGATTGVASIQAYGETPRKWKACIVPGQTKLDVTVTKGGRPFTVIFSAGRTMLAGECHTLEVNDWYEPPQPLIRKTLTSAGLSLSGNGTYYITQDDEIVTGGITLSGSPTVFIGGLNVAAPTAIDIKEGTPTLILLGTNKLVSTGDWNSGIQLSGETANVVLKGSGTLTVESGNGGTGIGSTYGVKCGDITIEGCTVDATAREGKDPLTGGAGIGSCTGTTCGNITIKDATIRAKGIGAGAGIGSGMGGDSNYGSAFCGNIVITRSTVTVRGSNYYQFHSAAIGSGGLDCQCGDITITLKAGQSKEAFLKNCTAGDADEVGRGNWGSTVGTITWKSSDGSVIETIVPSPPAEKPSWGS